MSVCILVSDDEKKVQETARRLLRNGIYRTYQPNVYSRFFNKTELGMRTYALENAKRDFELLRSTCERTILDLAQALVVSKLEPQHRFVTLVGNGISSYCFEEIETDEARVECQLTGKSVRKERAVGLRIWPKMDKLPAKQRFCSVFEQSKKVLEEHGDDSFIQFVDEHLDGMFRHSKLCYVSKRRLKFVKAVLKLATPDLFVNSWAVLWVENHNKNPDRSIELLDEEAVDSFVRDFRSAYNLIVRQTRAKSS